MASFLDNFFRCGWKEWIPSVFLAVALNIGLFLIMPALINAVPEKPSLETLISQVNLTRLRPPEEKKQPEPARPPEHKPAAVERPVPTTTVLPAPKLSLPFEINPRLPAGPTTLEFSQIDTSLAVGNLNELFSIDHLDGPLTALVQIPPVYPYNAKRRNIEGWVKVKFVVDEQGQVGGITVLESDPEGVFEQSVRRCLSGWRFKPGTIGGVKVKTLVEQTIAFKME